MTSKPKQTQYSKMWAMGNISNAPSSITLKVKVVQVSEEQRFGEGKPFEILICADKSGCGAIGSYQPGKAKVGDSMLALNVWRANGKTMIAATSTIKILKSDIPVPPEVLQAASKLEANPSMPASLAEAVASGGLHTVRATVVKVSPQKMRRTQQRLVPLRNLALLDASTRCKLALWRDTSEPELAAGTVVEVTHVASKEYQGEKKLQTTRHSTLQVRQSEEGLPIPPEIQNQYNSDVEFETDERQIEVLALVDEHLYQACPVHQKKLKDSFCDTCATKVEPIGESVMTLAVLIGEDATEVSVFSSVKEELLSATGRQLDDLEGACFHGVIKGNVLISVYYAQRDKPYELLPVRKLHRNQKANNYLSNVIV